MYFYKQILPVVIDRKERQSLLKNLSKNYEAVLLSAHDYLLRTGFENNILPINITGDLYFDKKNSNIYYVSIPDGKNFIEAGMLGEKDTKEPFEDFKSSVMSTVMAGRQIDSDHWKEINYINPKFAMLKENSLPGMINQEERNIASVLSDKETRNILSEISQNGTSFVEELANRHENGKLFEILEKMSNNGLINKEYFVFCRKTGQQVSRLFNIDSIQEASTRGLKCPHCGKTFMEEKIDQGISLTKLGRKFTRSNSWLIVYLMSLMEKLGIEPENIAVRQESDYKNIDAFINHFGRLIYISLKDEQQQLSDTYIFEKRMKIFKPDISIYITESPLSESLRHFIKNSGEETVIIESAKEAEEKISEILESQKQACVKETLKSFENFSGITINKIVADYLFHEQQKKLREHLLSVTETTEKPEQKRKTIISAISTEDDSLLIEEVISSANPIIYEESDETEPEEEEPVISDSDTIPIEQETETIGEATEESPEENPEESSEDMFMLEESLTTDFSSSQDTILIPELSSEEKSQDEKISEIKETLTGTIKKGLAGSWEYLNELMGELPETSSLSIATLNGLPLTQWNKETDGIHTAAYATEFFNIVTSSFVDENINSVFIDTSEKNISLAKTTGYLTIIENKKNASLNEGIGPSSNPEIRESIIPKVFVDLEKIDSIKGNMLVTENLDITEKNFQENKNAEMTAETIAVSSWPKFKDGAEKLLDGKPLRQMSIVTEECIYSIIPFSDGTLFVSAVDSTASREIWNLKLIDSARMLS